MAIIGVNAVILTGYIFAYPHLTPKNSQINNISSNINVVQADSSLEENTTFSSNPWNDSVSNDYEETGIIPETNLSSANTDYDHTKQEQFAKLANREELFQTQQQYTSSYEQNSQENLSPEQKSQDSYTAFSAEQEPYYALAQNIQETPDSSQNISEADSLNDDSIESLGSTGNANNFNIYNHPELQQTIDKFVINTDSLIFHLPKCNDVKKMAYENYDTSNASYEELIQDYDPCGHCLKNFSPTFISSPADAYEPAPYNNAPSQQDEEACSYVINTKEGYFHLPNGCKYVNKYSEPEDCIPTNSSREELSQKYRPCRFCFG